MKRHGTVWDRVASYRTAGERLVIGLMTGTSADGVDAALVRFRGHGLDATHEVVAYRETALSAALRAEVLDLAGAAELAPERLMRLDAALGDTYADAVAALLRDARVAPSAVAAIGSHGQTVRHLPRGENGGRALTLQLGSAAVLAERTGIDVVSDFRTRDTVCGGEGAPLVPIVDWWLFRDARESRVLLNLGGMANVTHLPAGCGLSGLLAFDTGPGNAVLDGLVAEASAGLARQDEGGRMAAQGRVHQGLLEELLADPFFAVAPPRSTGRERFGEAYARLLREIAEPLGLSLEDMLATAAELTAASVADAVARFLEPRGGVDAVYASGGGVRNATLMVALRRRLEGTRVARLDELGVASEAKEALAFALLAHLTLCGLPGNVPAATGARVPAVLGHITPGVAPGEEQE
ncbi:MAG: anhydro-N-acetylmuramic acid kinase [Candidatus Eisenbacteria bacterium]|nr:anhydro-N-acetylmuramic acid kinase [Candidatus Eisenbacteria bacterium]